MTEGRAGAEVSCIAIFLSVLGFLWPSAETVPYLHLMTIFLFLAVFFRLRAARRPFPPAVQFFAGACLALPAMRGGPYLAGLCLVPVWIGFLELTRAAIRQRWMQEVRHRYAAIRLDRHMREAAAIHAGIKTRVDRVQEDIALYQTVYDLAMRHTAGMSRADILTAAGASLKELARRRRLHIQDIYLFLVSGEEFDLQNPGAGIVLDEKMRSCKEEMMKSFLEEGETGGPSWSRSSMVGLPIRHQERILGGLLIHLSGSASPTPQVPMSPTSAGSSGTENISEPDVKLLSVTADLLGLAIQNGLLYEQVNRMATTDRLTGLFVLWYFNDRLKEESHRAIRSHRPISVLMLDVDHFKRVNDMHGHLAGDAVLKEIAARVKSSLREGDLLARYGGEEMAAILPETSAEGAGRVAERIRLAVESKPIESSAKTLQVTISIGVNDLTRIPASSDPTLTASRLLKGADEALYEAKHGGRNCVRIYAGSGTSAEILVGTNVAK